MHAQKHLLTVWRFGSAKSTADDFSPNLADDLLLLPDLADADVLLLLPGGVEISMCRCQV